MNFPVPGLNFKKSNIRIWIHQRNMANLQQVVWEGHGGMLLVEHSNNAKIKKFLEAVPHIMGLIKEIHIDVLNNDLEKLKEHATPPIPTIVLNAKDANGLTPLHKAVGLDKQEIAEYIIKKCPESINSIDNEGRTPLHYAALLKDDGKMTNFLIENGADESALDNKQKTAAYYKTRHSEIDAKLLNVIPDCPRSAKEHLAASFDWNMLSSSPSLNWIQNGTKKADTVIDNSDNKENGNEADTVIDNSDNKENENENEENNTENDLPDKKENNVIDEPAENGTHAPDPSTKTEPNEENIEQLKEENIEELKEKNIEEPKEENMEELKEVNIEELKEESTPSESDKPEDTAKETEIKILDEVKSNNSGDVHDEDEKLTYTNEVLIDKNEPQNTEDTNNKNENTETGEDETDNNNNNDTEDKEKVQEDAFKQSEEQQSMSRPVSNTSRPSSTKSRPSSNTKKETKSRPVSKMNENLIEGGEGVIEGIVNGEDEVETMNNEGMNEPRANDIDEDVKLLVEAGNMEQLATFVLNGEGDRLIGMTSTNPELQTFLENVPAYMSKIHRIHEAARSGSLRELQAALDRRKFAIAKDAISPKGASALHVAVIFGNTSIVRYLAGRFPETLQMVDDDGRTPLHYAAILNDNGHYYNLLIHLGADMRVEDKMGFTPEYYRKNQQDFNHRGILKDFGAEDEEADEILADKDKLTADNGQVDMPFFATEEGRYLASSLGDPLIKGLTEVANKRPGDPIAYLAQYLYNFANNRNGLKSRGKTQENVHQQLITGSPTAAENNNAIPASIDVVTVEPNENETDDSAFSPTSRDEHGQSMLHFAAARSHGRNALFQLLQETEINVAFRDELYRTARDISIQANLPENTEEIDRYVLHIATKGDTDKLVELLLDGYDHITDIVDNEDVPIIEAVSKANQPDTVSFLQSILTFEEKRERVHHAIRQGSVNDVIALLADENDTGSGKLLAIGKNSYGRSTLHIAVLCQQEEIVDFLANTFPDTLKLGDNLERTALHYAMGVDKMETISRVLIKAGAVRVVKDLKGRQPTYYFLNKSEILRLQEEEETF